jgi:CRP-like cAMP-binding protein
VASVSLNDVRVARISPGEFVGEIAFLAGRPATATVVAVEPGRALVWPRDKLARWVQRDAKMHTAMYAAMGQNLAEKMAAADVAMTRT